MSRILQTGIFLCACLTFWFTGQAQEIVETPEISRMMEEFVRFNKEHQTAKGWRIQVLATTERRLMERTRAEFERIYPEYTLDFEHNNPYYLLKTGTYLNRNDALPMLRKLQMNFPGAFLVNEEIELAEVLENPF